MIMNRTTVFLAWMLAGAFLAALPARAEIMGKIEGRVYDSEGLPLDKVSVTIISQWSSAVRFEVTTKADGKFIQIGLQPGYYLVSLKKAGFLPATTEVRVRIDETSQLEIKMRKGSEVLERALSESDNLFLKGNKLYAEKKYEEAAAVYREAIAKSGLQWGYHFNLGLALKKLGRPDESKAALLKALELNPESYSVNREVGENLAKAGDYAAARPYYQKAVELSPDDPDAHYNLGVCLTNQGESEAALASFQKAIQLEADYADAYYQAATIQIGLNKKEEAIQNLEKFVSLAPDHPQAGLARQLLDFLKKK
jgi:tetratricopeptide (TPR) repeat protein